MGLPSVKVESRSDVSDDENQAEKVASRARVRAAELLQKPFDVVDCPHRFVYPGSLLHHLLHALDPAANRSCAAPQLSVEADSTWTRSIEDSAAGERRVHPYRTSCTFRLWNIRAGYTHSEMARESSGRFDGTATQAPAGKNTGGASDSGDWRNREAGFN